MDLQALLKLAPAFIRPALQQLLARLEAVERDLAELKQARKP